MNNVKTQIPDFGWQLEGDRIAVKRDEDEKVSQGGIIIPDTATEEANTGIIIALGDEITHDVNGLKHSHCKFFIMQPVKFGKYAGSEITGDDGEKYLIMRTHDILGYRTREKYAMIMDTPTRPKDVKIIKPCSICGTRMELMPSVEDDNDIWKCPNLTCKHITIVHRTNTKFKQL